MAKKKATEINQEKIISFYIDYVLINNKKPNSIYEFAKTNEFEEVDFYKYFTSFEMLEASFFSDMITHTLNLIQKSPDYDAYDASQKLSCFYFTFFEMATANRSFLIFILNQEKNPLKINTKLKEFKNHFLSYLKIILEAPYNIDNVKIKNIQNRVIHQGAWLQFMTILKYWMHDTSANFEKTDIFIEKSIKASFDIVYNVPVESILDFGKFIWKEKFGNFNSKQ